MVPISRSDNQYIRTFLCLGVYVCVSVCACKSLVVQKKNPPPPPTNPTLPYDLINYYSHFDLDFLLNILLMIFMYSHYHLHMLAFPLSNYHWISEEMMITTKYSVDVALFFLFFFYFQKNEN